MLITDTRVPTGVQGLNEMLEGGYPEKSIILISGGPGTGKTIKSLQYTVAAIEQGEPVVYVNLEEPMEKKKQYSRGFGWDLEKAEKDGLLLTLDFQLKSSVDGIIEPRNRHTGESRMSLEYEITEEAKKIGAKHIVIDPLNSLLINARGSSEIRYLVHRIFETIRDLGCSALITYEGSFDVDSYYSEMFLSDGVVALVKDMREFQVIKTIRIDKMRGIDFDDQPRRYTITTNGMVVFNKEPVLV